MKLSLIFTCATVAALCSSRALGAGQTPATGTNDPLNPIAPTSSNQCFQLGNEWNQRVALLRQQYNDCDKGVYNSCTRLPLNQSNQCFSREKNPGWRLGDYLQKVALYSRCEPAFQSLKAAEARAPVAVKQCRDEVEAASRRNGTISAPQPPRFSGGGPVAPAQAPSPFVPGPARSPTVNAPAVERLKLKFEHLSSQYDALMNRSLQFGRTEVSVQGLIDACVELAHTGIVELLKELPLTSVRNALGRSVGVAADNPVVEYAAPFLDPENARNLRDAAAAARRSATTNTWNANEARQLQELERALGGGR